MDTKTPATDSIEMFDPSDVQPDWERMEVNRGLRPAGWTPKWDECGFCGRPLDPSKPVAQFHLSVTGELFPVAMENADAHPDTQGWFSIGGGCMRKLPKAYRTEPTVIGAGA
jgi:hypothetical protein